MKRCPKCGWVELDNEVQYCPHCIYKAELECVDNASEEDMAKYKKKYEAQVFLYEMMEIEYGSDLDNSYVPPTETELFFMEARAEREAREKEYERTHPNAVKCPKCGSYSVATTNRGYSILTGFIGSGSPRNVCQKCGYKWKPGK